MAVSKERIEEVRAAWAADRETRRKEFKRDWPMYLLQIVGEVGLGIALGLALVVWALQSVV